MLRNRGKLKQFSENFQNSHWICLSWGSTCIRKVKDLIYHWILLSLKQNKTKRKPQTNPSPGKLGTKPSILILCLKVIIFPPSVRTNCFYPCLAQWAVKGIKPFMCHYNVGKMDWEKWKLLVRVLKHKQWDFRVLYHKEGSINWHFSKILNCVPNTQRYKTAMAYGSRYD